ncbi:HNH endonuclease [Citreimonas salinaria]|nr:HNH endonuclease [Citreimonas salinaria]
MNQIVRRVCEIAPPPLPEKPDAAVRRTIQDACREARGFKHRADLFQSVHGIDARKGVWRLRTDLLNPSEPDSVQDGAEAFIEAEEGRANLRIHLRRERSRKLIEAFKAERPDASCEACGMRFSEIYGELGAGYIEAHHKVPVAQLKDGSKTKISDLAALCANCHRIIHKNNLMPVEELAKLLAERTNLQH